MFVIFFASSDLHCVEKAVVSICCIEQD